MKAKYWAYRDRKTRKRNVRSLWIVRLNAAVRAQGITYNRFIEGLKAANILLDRKVLSDTAIQDEGAFTQIIAAAKAALAAKPNQPTASKAKAA